MEQKTKEVWIIPITITLVIGVLLIVWGGWYNGIHYHNPLSWMKDALFARVPVWGTLITVVLAAMLAGLNIRERARFDAFEDFSIDMNPAGPWLYGSTSTLGGPITLLETKLPGILGGRADQWTSKHGGGVVITKNKTPRFTYLTHDMPHDALHMHPGQGGIFAVVRWTCPHDGRYSIRGDFSGLDYEGKPDVAVCVMKNSINELAADELRGAPAQMPFGSELSMRKGDTIDFVVGVGQSGNYCNGSTGLRAKVQRIRR